MSYLIILQENLCSCQQLTSDIHYDFIPVAVGCHCSLRPGEGVAATSSSPELWAIFSLWEMVFSRFPPLPKNWLRSSCLLHFWSWRDVKSSLSEEDMTMTCSWGVSKLYLKFLEGTRLPISQLLSISLQYCFCSSILQWSSFLLNLEHWELADSIVNQLEWLPNDEWEIARITIQSVPHNLSSLSSPSPFS